MTPAPHQIAGRYTVERAVGRGASGTVWLCQDELLGRRVAVKQVGGLPGDSVPGLDRALREARSAAGLTHPNVVSVFDAVEDDGRSWIVMEYVPSRSLAELLAEDGPLDPRRAAALGAQAAEGLAAAHARGVVHRDVKPGNLLVTDDDRVKITDFGIARTTGDPRMTQTGMVVGTPAYFAPEAARGGAPAPAGDVWSLGATLYEAVEGRQPYADRGSAIALLVAITAEEPHPPQRSGALAGPIAAMMRRDPADRPTMAEAARQLSAVAAGARTEPGTAVLAAAPVPEPATEPEPEPVPVPVGAADEPRRRRPVLLLAAAAVLLLVLAAVGVALATRGDDAGTPSAGPTSGAERRGAANPGRRSTEPSAEPTSEPSSDPAPETAAPPPAPEETEDEPEETEDEPEETEQPEEGEGDPAGFAETYYSYLPDDTGAAYQLLSEDYRAGMSQSSYEGFWRTVDDVQVSDVQVVDDTTVDVTLTYTTDGRSQSETRRLYLADDGSGFVIADDEIV